MQESPTPNQNLVEQEAPRSSGFPKLLLVIVILIVGAGFYWYLNTPKVATFENKAIAAFNTNHTFDSPALKAYGDGIVVIAPFFKRDEDIKYVDLGLSVWAKQAGKFVQVKEIEIAGLTLPFDSIPLISPANVDSGLFRSDATLKSKIPVEDLINAANKSGGKLKLTLKVDIIENVPQRRVHPQTINYEFDVRSQHVTPWSN